MMIRRPKLVTGNTPMNDLLRLDHDGRLDIWQCIFDNNGSIGNCVSVAGAAGGGGMWERLSVHGASENCSGILVGQSSKLHLIDVSSLYLIYIHSSTVFHSFFLVQHIFQCRCWNHTNGWFRLKIEQLYYQ